MVRRRAWIHVRDPIPRPLAWHSRAHRSCAGTGPLRAQSKTLQGPFLREAMLAQTFGYASHKDRQLKTENVVGASQVHAQ